MDDAIPGSKLADKTNRGWYSTDMRKQPVSRRVLEKLESNSSEYDLLRFIAAFTTVSRDRFWHTARTKTFPPRQRIKEEEEL